MARRARIKNGIKFYKPIVKWIITHIGVLVVIAVFLLLSANLSTRTIFTNRLDETRAVALTYSFQALPFESRDIISNFSGEKIAVLNVTFQGQTQILYSENFTSKEMKNIGTLQKDGRTILVLLPFDVEEGKEYVIDANFSVLYKYGTREQVPVLIVESRRDFTLMDEFASMNRNLLFHVTIGLWILTAACAFVILGSIFWLSMKLSESNKE